MFCKECGQYTERSYSGMCQGCYNYFRKGGTNVKCDKCNLCKNTDNPFLMGRGKKHAKIMFIQDAPTQLESRKGKQFAGKTFQRFKELIESRDIDLTDIYWTSVVKCPLSDENAELTMAQCKECLDYLYTEPSSVQHSRLTKDT